MKKYLEKVLIVAGSVLAVCGVLTAGTEVVKGLFSVYVTASFLTSLFKVLAWI